MGDAVDLIAKLDELIAATRQSAMPASMRWASTLRLCALRVAAAMGEQT